MEPVLMQLLIGAAGLFTIVGAIQDWDWFMNHRRAWIFVKLLGRKGARIFYIILGTAIALFALQM
ncbi:immunity 17 family protein [Microcoleus sp. FACHB-1515]|uniref:immunity 17 family protein n=1 Tax=Cyanophyceae TaxID=3028117 RepID=UPI001681F42B|nr:immunity 17 family protein [Microcoleus sp. FACHB-1515]MBD2090179.1 immunity 17 family protein [Microcoleus sp. FACHB-1515]